jgi:undecaprenyl pyrophosphate synthase
MVKEEEVSKRMAKFTVDLKTAIKYYLQLTKPMHKLADKRIELLTEILYLYTIEQKNFKRPNDAWTIVFSGENRANIRQKMDMTKQVFENYLSEFRKKGIIVNNQVDPKYNPSIKPGCKSYELLFKFDIADG